MSKDKRKNEKEAAIPLLTEKAARSDIVSALAVEIAIGLSHLLGARIAASFLRKHKLDIDVALRVLLRPAQRRRYQMPALQR